MRHSFLLTYIYVRKQRLRQRKVSYDVANALATLLVFARVMFRQSWTSQCCHLACLLETHSYYSCNLFCSLILSLDSICRFSSVLLYLIISSYLNICNGINVQGCNMTMSMIWNAGTIEPFNKPSRHESQVWFFTAIFLLSIFHNIQAERIIISFSFYRET